MDYVRIAIIDANNATQLAFMDNSARDALHYYDDTLHTYLTGSAYTFECKVEKDHEDAQYIQAGNKLSFVYDQKPYNLTIMQTHEEERFIELTAYGCCFELLNETAPAYTATTAKTFVQYLEIFLSETSVVQVGINEVSDQSRKLEWTGDTDSLLKRIYSLADNFDAEVEIIPTLNPDYTLSTIVLNIYKEHSDTQQGIGEDRSDITLRYGVNVNTVKKDVDVTELYTAILPTGKDDLTLTTYAAQTVYDDDGNVLYTKPANDPKIYAPQARDRYPSNVVSESDRYILYRWSTEYSTKEALYGNALAKLKEISVPKATYEVEGYADLNIGDTVIIYDDQFQPALYLSARVTEQEISFTDESRNKTTFDNFREMTSQISADLLERVQELASQVAQSIAGATVEYYVSTSANELVGGEWSTNTPLIQPGMYAWTRTKFTQADGAIYYSEPARFTGAEEIGDGTTTKTTVYYLATDQSSGVTTNTPGWTTTTQDISATYPYLWTYTKTETSKRYIGNPVVINVSDATVIASFNISFMPTGVGMWNGEYWAAGNRKNLLKPTLTASDLPVTINGVEFSVANYGTYGYGVIRAFKRYASSSNSELVLFDSPYSQLGEGDYNLSGTPTSDIFSIVLQTTAGQTIVNNRREPSGTAFHLGASEKIQSITLKADSSVAIGADVEFMPMIRLASEPDYSWEPYSARRAVTTFSSVAISDNGTSVVTVSWSSPAGAVTGGVIDVISGALSVNRGRKAISKNTSELECGQTAGGYNYVRCAVSGGVQDDPSIMSTYYGAVTEDAEIGVRYNNGYIYIYDPHFTDIDTAKEYLESNTVSYALSEPDAYTIQGTQISLSTGAHTVEATRNNAKIAQEIMFYEASADSVPIIIGRYGSDGQTGPAGPAGPAGANGKMLFGTCSTATETAAKVVACSEATELYAGLAVFVSFSVANSSDTALTLNVNNLGAKDVYCEGAVTSSTNPLLWAANASILFIYDGTAWIATGYGKSYFGTSATAATSRAKSSSIAGFVGTRGTRVSIRFTNANTYTAAAPRLNVSATGAIDIYLNSSAVAGDSPYLWGSGEIQTFIFVGNRWEIDNTAVIAKALA